LPGLAAELAARMRKQDQLPASSPATEVFTFGQILVRPVDKGCFRLTHRDDAKVAVEILRRFRNAEDALEIAHFDDTGNYRPLKTAPNLRHGWQLELTGEENLRRALDYFYPGRLAMIAARAENRLKNTALRETLGRQSGMYRVAATISDQQLDDLIGNFCRSDGGCLRTIFWKRDVAGTVPSTRLPAEKFDPDFDQASATGAISHGSMNLPLLCQEACNLLVAECRKVVKSGGGG
jgi:sirohydrochlorin cobaltochelatase